MNAEGSGHVKLTNNTADDTEPVFSPDGSKIAFQSDRDGYPDNEIYTMNVDGSGQTELDGPVVVRRNSEYAHPSWGVEANAAPTITAFGAMTARDSRQQVIAIALRSTMLRNVGNGKVKT